eukprot:1997426-Rhodomonas_salina.1
MQEETEGNRKGCKVGGAVFSFSAPGAPGSKETHSAKNRESLVVECAKMCTGESCGSCGADARKGHCAPRVAAPQNWGWRLQTFNGLCPHSAPTSRPPRLPVAAAPKLIERGAAVVGVAHRRRIPRLSLLR